MVPGALTDPRGIQEIGRARDLLLSVPSRWRVIYHNDGDGIASASVLAHALARLGRPFQLTPLVGIEETRLRDLLRATRGPVLVADTGSSFLPLFAEHPHPVVVLDHHIPPEGPWESPHVAFVNPHHWDVDGMSELSASMLSYVFARSLSEENLDLLAWGLSGAIADRQHVGGFRGLNGRLLEEGERAGVVRRLRSLSLAGESLLEAITRSVDPYYVGLSGDPDGTRAFLARLGLSPRAPPSSLSPEESERLGSALLLRLMDQGARPEFCERVSEERFLLPRLPGEALEVSRLQNAAAREGEASVGVALALGDRSAWERAVRLEAAWRQGVLQGLKRLEGPQGVTRRGAIQWFATPDVPLAGTIAGLGLTYFLDPTRPVFSFSESEGRIKVSARGTLWLTGRGLDLAAVCREAAKAVGGEGGGHRVASGATLPAGSQERFLSEADRRVGDQLTRIEAAKVA